MMITQRPLTENELNQLLDEAPETETRNLKAYMREYGATAYEFFEDFGVDYFGLLDDGRPIYVAVLVEGSDKRRWFWTVVNCHVPVISLCKYVKRELKRWYEKYGEMWCHMEKVNPENMKWVEWLQFRKTEEDEDTITYCLKGA